MAIYNLGSINIDHVYRVPHLPAPGETLAALGYDRGLGGKGANQSVAAARAGARVLHIGACGTADAWVLDELAGYGVDISLVSRANVPTGHAIINVDPEGENAIVLYPGANMAQDGAAVVAALSAAEPRDTLMLQNETAFQHEAARVASARGLRVIYSAAPFDITAVRAVLPHVSLLVMNEGEAAALAEAEGALPDIEMIITLGSRGAEWRRPGLPPLRQAAFAVEPVDTTGAGDCFIGTLAAALDLGLAPEQAMRRAAAASAIEVTRAGAAQAVPTAAEVDAFLAERG